MNWIGLRKRFKNASQKWMQRSIAPCIKQFSSNNNFSSLTDKLQLGTEISGAFFVFELINQTTKNEGGGYKHKSTRLVRDFSSIHLSCPKFKRETGTRKQELLNRLSNYDHMTPYRRASLKRHSQTAGWLTESTQFADWIADPKSSIFILSGKRESFSEINA